MAVKIWYVDGEMANLKGEVLRAHPEDDGFVVTYSESEEVTEIVCRNNTVMVRKVNRNGTNG